MGCSDWARFMTGSRTPLGRFRLDGLISLQARSSALPKYPPGDLQYVIIARRAASAVRCTGSVIQTIRPTFQEVFPAVGYSGKWVGDSTDTTFSGKGHSPRSAPLYNIVWYCRETARRDTVVPGSEAGRNCCSRSRARFLSVLGCCSFCISVEPHAPRQSER